MTWQAFLIDRGRRSPLCPESFGSYLDCMVHVRASYPQIDLASVSVVPVDRPSDNRDDPIEALRVLADHFGFTLREPRKLDR